MNARPTSITVVAIILIVLSVFSLFSACMTAVFMALPQFSDPQIQKAVRDAMAANPIPPAMQLAMVGIGGLAQLITGIALLRGRSWARWLYLVYYVVMFGMVLVTSRARLLLMASAIQQLILLYFMFRPVAPAADNARSPAPLRPSAIVFYVVAGFFVYALGLMAFMRGPGELGALFMIVATIICAVPLLVFLTIGLVLSGFKTWLRDIGVVLLSGTAVTATATLTFACMLYYPEYLKLMPAGYASHVNFATGACMNLAILVVGAALLLLSRAFPPRALNPNSTSTEQDASGGLAADLANPYRSPTYPQ